MSITVERGSGVALWRQIEETLAGEIARKQLRERLPNEATLAERFGVNRHTIRRAVQALEARGMVRIEQGRGTFVQEEFIDYKLGKRSRFFRTVWKNNSLLAPARFNAAAAWCRAMKSAPCCRCPMVVA